MVRRLISGGVILLAVVASACAPPAQPAALVASSDVEEVELAPLMGQMQRYATKLGYSLDARNTRLAIFYLEELDEVLEELMEVGAHDGMPIAEPASIILAPLLEPLLAGVSAGAWDAVDAGYAALVDGCNRCHAATEHEFIVILEPDDAAAPFNQAF